MPTLNSRTDDKSVESIAGVRVLAKVLSVTFHGFCEAFHLHSAANIASTIGIYPRMGKESCVNQTQGDCEYQPRHQLDKRSHCRREDDFDRPENLHAE